MLGAEDDKGGTAGGAEDDKGGTAGGADETDEDGQRRPWMMMMKKKSR